MDNQVLKMHIQNTRNLPIAFDLHLSKARGRRPLVVFCHGFKGFKDWGSFNYIAKCFANAEMHFLKFNFSGNGTTPNDLLNFADVDAFGNNNFSKELEDLDCVLNWVESDFEKTAGCSFSSITLMGHSRGGGIAILKAAKDSRIKKLITWAAVADFEKMLGSYDNEQWKQDGVVYIRNARTNQNMPLHYQLYTDLMENKDDLNIIRAAKIVSAPWLIVHAKDDAVVPLSEAEKLNDASTHGNLQIIAGGAHTFGGVHPFNESHISEYLQEAISKSIKFITLSNNNE